MLLLTSPGQTHETPIPFGARLQRRLSLSPRTANLVDPGRARGEPARHARGVDDIAALAMRDHARRECHHAIDRAVEIDPHQPVPVRIARFLDRLEQVHPGIVEQQGYGAEFRLDAVRRLSHCVARRDVDLDPHDHVIVERGERLRNGFLANVGHRDLAAFGEQRPHKANADAIGAAGDKGGPSHEVNHRCTSF
jgi:hypothetical protein